MQLKEKLFNVLRQSGALLSVTAEVHDFLIVRTEAERIALPPVNDLELQDQADRYRQSLGLLTAEQFNEWFSSQIALNWSDFESLIAYQVLRQKVKAYAIANSAPEEVELFRKSLQIVSLTTVVVGEEGLCRELKSMIEDEDEDIHLLAEQYSRDLVSAPFGGRMGPKRLIEFPMEIWGPVSSATQGNIVGPLLVEDHWWISRLDGMTTSPLETTDIEFADEAWFRTWLERRRSEVSFSVQVEEGA